MSPKPDGSDISKLRTADGDWIAPEELHEVLADEGYSGDDRKQFLTSVLTELSQEEVRAGRQPDRHEELLNEVRNILSKEQGKEGRDPKSDDV